MVKALWEMICALGGTVIQGIVTLCTYLVSRFIGLGNLSLRDFAIVVAITAIACFPNVPSPSPRQRDKWRPRTRYRIFIFLHRWLRWNFLQRWANSTKRMKPLPVWCWRLLYSVVAAAAIVHIFNWMIPLSFVRSRSANDAIHIVLQCLLAIAFVRTWTKRHSRWRGVNVVALLGLIFFFLYGVLFGLPDDKTRYWKEDQFGEWNYWPREPVGAEKHGEILNRANEMVRDHPNTFWGWPPEVRKLTVIYNLEGIKKGPPFCLVGVPETPQSKTFGLNAKAVGYVRLYPGDAREPEWDDVEFVTKALHYHAGSTLFHSIPLRITRAFGRPAEIEGWDFVAFPERNPATVVWIASRKLFQNVEFDTFEVDAVTGEVRKLRNLINAPYSFPVLYGPNEFYDGY